MGKIKINETASEPDMKKGSNTKRSDFDDSTELIMPIEHYVTVSAKVENPEAGASVEGVKSAPRKKSGMVKVGAKGSRSSASGDSKGASVKKTAGAAGRKKTLALPAGSIGAAVISEKEKAAGAVGGAAAGTAKKSSMDGMVKPKARMVEVTEIEPVDDEDYDEQSNDDDVRDERSEKEENPRFSKPKAILIGVGVTLVVALVGGLVIGLMSHKDKPLCMVQFESNGGSKIESAEVVCGETVERPDDPTKEGFAFQNWIYGGAPFDFEQMTIDEDTVLVAKWQVEEGVETVTVKFDTVGGSEIEDIEIKKGGVISEPVAPERTSYEFVGWKLGDEDFDFSQPIEEDMTLVAVWQPVAGGSTSGGSSNPAPEKPSVESLVAADASMKVGDTKRFDITIKPSNARYKLGVSSSNPEVATCKIIDDNRLQCEAKAAGETTILLRDSLSGKNTQFKLTATSEVTFVEMKPRTLSLEVGDTGTLDVNVTATGAVGAAKWTTNNSNVATVDQSGKVTAVSAGVATITVTVGGMSDSCTVKVKAKTATPVTPPVVDPEPETPPVNPPEEGGNTSTSGE